MSYSQADGTLQLGIRLHRSFNPNEYRKDKGQIPLTESLLLTLTEQLNGTAVLFRGQSEEGTLKLDRYQQQFVLETDSNRLAMDIALERILGKRFVSVNGVMRVYVAKSILSVVLLHLKKEGYRFVAVDHQKELLKHLGVPSDLTFTPVE